MEETVKLFSRYRVPILVEKKQWETEKRNSKKKTHEEYVEELNIKNPNVEVIGKYINAKTKITHRCLIHDVYWEVSPESALRGYGCKICKREKLYNSFAKTHEEYIKELKNINLNIEVIDKYIDSNTPIKHYCKTHNVFWNARPNNILNGRGCSLCGIEKTSNFNRRTHEEYVEQVEKLNKNIKVIGDYINSNTPILHKCLIDGYEWNTIPNVILRGSGCPKCANNIKKTHEKYIDELKVKNPNVIPLEDYIDANTPIMHYHKNCKHETKMSPSSTLNGSGCILCKGLKIGESQSKSHEQFIEEIKKINKNIIILSLYVKSSEKIKCNCKICNYTWEVKAGHLLQGHGCPNCAHQILADKLRKTHSQFVNELLLINPYIEVLGNYTTTNQKILCKCKKCYYEWMSKPIKLLKGQGCPRCNESIGERNISIFLSSNNLPYLKYYKYNDLIGVGGRLLSYDFYLPTFNLLIEFQGEQHERSVEHFGGEEKFKIQQEHDNRKRNYAKEHNINLLEIWYYDINNIETILTKYLNNLKLETVETTGVA